MHRGCLKQLVLQWTQVYKCDSVPVAAFKSNCPKQLTQAAHKTLPIQRAHLRHWTTCFGWFVLSILVLFLPIGHHPLPHWKHWDPCSWLQRCVEPVIIPVQILVPKNSPPPTTIVFISCWTPPTAFLGMEFPTLHSLDYQSLEQLLYGCVGLKLWGMLEGSVKGHWIHYHMKVKCSWLHSSSTTFSLDYLSSY